MKNVVLAGVVITITVTLLAQGFGLPSCIAEMKSRPALDPYVAYLQEHKNVKRAFDPCNESDAVINLFITKLEQAELTNLPPTAPVPAAYLTKQPDINLVNITQAETNEIRGANLAHIFYIEVNRLVPWRIYNYPKKELTKLFDFQLLPGSQNVLNHSPREAWDVLQRNIDMSAVKDPVSAVEELFKYGRSFRHALSTDSDLGIVTVSDMDTIGGSQQSDLNVDRISRRGCWSMVPFMQSLAQAMNIPSQVVTNYYAGKGHATASFSLTNQVFAHGDDPYNAILRNTPAATAIDSYDRWKKEVLIAEPGQGLYSDAGISSRTHNYENYRLYPAQFLMQRYCGIIGASSGRAYLDSFFVEDSVVWASPAELDDLEVRINETTNNCTVVPDDDPESLISPV